MDLDRSAGAKAKKAAFRRAIGRNHIIATAAPEKHDQAKEKTQFLLSLSSGELLSFPCSAHPCFHNTSKESVKEEDSPHKEGQNLEICTPPPPSTIRVFLFFSARERELRPSCSLPGLQGGSFSVSPAQSPTTTIAIFRVPLAGTRPTVSTVPPDVAVLRQPALSGHCALLGGLCRIGGPATGRSADARSSPVCNRRSLF
ncbi:predicted protein [Coccidioides posadasii str. Silveira]|uniref:Predicted protein n=1 Tax=Coccidioides posadasii (strain RMSCC 757 / Silveira) TaxID=443226 RepID=E9DGL2_COCPS|nr:predicted protein [Coccidioides posadasii str. Silveira]